MGPIMLGKGGRSRFGALGSIDVGSLGVRSYDRYFSPAARAIGRGVKIDNSNSVRLTFEPIDLYPQETADLDQFYVLTNTDHTGTTLDANWSARARDVSGAIRGVIEIEVDPKVPTIDELLGEPEGKERVEED